jgi:hypothetical protein
MKAAHGIGRRRRLRSRYRRARRPPPDGRGGGQHRLRLRLRTAGSAPRLRLGWRQNISVDPGETIGRFASGGSSFTLDPTDIEGGGPIAGFRLSVGNELGMLTINADAEMLEDYVRYTLLLRASFRF